MVAGAKLTMISGDFDVVNAFAPSYYLDVIQGVTSGSRTYNIPPGKSITAQSIGEVRYRDWGDVSVSVSGQTVTWSNLRSDTLIITAV